MSKPPENCSSYASLSRTMPDLVHITKIVATPKEPSLRRIQSGRHTVALIHHHDVDALALQVGTCIDAQLALDLERCHARAALRLKAIRSLSRTAATRHQLDQRLQRGGGSPADVAAVLDQLTEEGLLDDLKAARQLIAESMRRGGLGQAAMLDRLLRRGIDETIAQRAVEEAMAGCDELEQARQVGMQMMRSLRHHPSDVAARRLAGRLARRGFPPEIVKATVCSLTGATEDADGTIDIDARA